jgi:hypothetical protein
MPLLGKVATEPLAGTTLGRSACTAGSADPDDTGDADDGTDLLASVKDDGATSTATARVSSTVTAGPANAAALELGTARTCALGESASAPCRPEAPVGVALERNECTAGSEDTDDTDDGMDLLAGAKDDGATSTATSDLPVGCAR